MNPDQLDKMRENDVTEADQARVDEPCTQTLCDDDGNPTLITLEGHVGLEEFNSAMKNEWEGDDLLAEHGKYLKHEYYIPSTDGPWIKATKSNPKAKPYTTMPWDF